MHLQPGRDIGPAVLHETMLACPGVGAPDRLQAELEGDLVVDVAAALEIHGHVDDATGLLHKAVNPVLMGSPMLHVLRADICRLGQPELALEGPPPGRENRVGIGGLGRRVGVHVIARAIRAPVSGPGDELGKLLVQVAAGDDAAWLDDRRELVALGFEQVSREVAAAAAPGGAGDHRTGARPGRSRLVLFKEARDCRAASRWFSTRAIASTMDCWTGVS